MAKQKELKAPGLPIMYIDRANYTEIAYMLRDLLMSKLATTPINASDADVDVEDLAKYLEEGILTESLQGFLEDDFGKGMVLGFYMEHKLNLAKREEEEMLKELEGEA